MVLKMYARTKILQLAKIPCAPTSALLYVLVKCLPLLWDFCVQEPCQYPPTDRTSAVVFNQ